MEPPAQVTAMDETQQSVIRSIAKTFWVDKPEVKVGPVDERNPHVVGLSCPHGVEFSPGHATNSVVEAGLKIPDPVGVVNVAERVALGVAIIMAPAVIPKARTSRERGRASAVRRTNRKVVGERLD